MGTVAKQPVSAWPARLFPVLAGCFLSLCLLKFGNPPVMERWVTPPADLYEAILTFPWPLRWAYAFFAVVVLAGAVSARLFVPRCGWQKALVAAPAAWLAWQLIASADTMDSSLSAAVVAHFAVAVLFFYLGVFSLSRVHVRSLAFFWLAVLAGFWLVLFHGFSQHFGGLEETRRYFFLYIYPQMTEVSPEYLKKMSTNRIFGTLFYPNALAGAILLFLPPLVAVLFSFRERLTIGARAFLAGATAAAAIACLVWSGSKGGWLIMLVIGAIALLRLPMPKAIRTTIIVLLLAGGLTGFFWRYAGFFQRGATSVSARFDYWRAAVKTTLENPVLGTGPGTFGTAYSRIKRPESEPARLTHNDYLQQASDSGIPGVAIYMLFLVGTLVATYPRVRSVGPGGESTYEHWVRFSIWLGLLGWSLQGLMEFGLYIPATAWGAFVLFGYLLGKRARGADPV